MGYYSYYSLDVDVSNSDYHKLDIIADLRNGNYEASGALNANGETNQEAKWYTFDDDMKIFSMKYHNVLFALCRRGQEFNDAEKIYFKNGESKSCKALMSFRKISNKELNSCPPEFINSLNEEYCIVKFSFNTNYEMGNQEIIDIIKHLKASYSEADHSLNAWGNFRSSGSWPSYASNLIDFSKKYPHVEFYIQRNINYEVKISMNDISDFGYEIFKNGRRHVFQNCWTYKQPKKWRN